MQSCKFSLRIKAFAANYQLTFHSTNERRLEQIFDPRKTPRTRKKPFVLLFLSFSRVWRHSRTLFFDFIYVHL